MVVTVMVEKRDRLTLSRDIELIADRIARSGHTGRADELKVVAARYDIASGVVSLLGS